MRRTPRYYSGTAKTTKHLQHVLKSVLKNVRGKQNLRPDLVLQAWSEIMPPQFSSMTQAERFEEGVLYIKVNNSTLHGLLHQHEKPKILKCLRKKFPNVTINNIVFRMG